MTISNGVKKYCYFTAFSIMAIGVVHNLIVQIVLKFEPTSHFGVMELSMITIPFGFLRMAIPDVLYFAIYYGLTFLIFRRMWLILRLRKLLMPSTLTAPLWGIISTTLVLIIISLVFKILYNLFEESFFLATISAYSELPALILLPIGICFVEFFSLLFDRSSKVNIPNAISNDAT